MQERLNEKIESLQNQVNAKQYNNDPNYICFAEEYENKVYALNILLEIRDGE